MNELTDLLDEMNNKYANKLEKEEDSEEDIADMNYLLQVSDQNQNTFMKKMSVPANRIQNH